MRKIARKSAWNLICLSPLILIGCGDSQGGIDPTIKVEAGKSADDSVNKTRSGVGTKQEPAPLQRTKSRPG